MKGSKFLKDPENRFYFSDEKKDTIQVEAEAKRLMGEDPKGSLAYVCMCDNEKLPFENESFEAYISSLSLMVVDNP